MLPNFVILAAGKGSRLRGAVPKPLTELVDGRTILQQQLENIVTAFGKEALKETFVVVGFRAEEVVEALPDGVRAIYNTAYDESNTSKSLLGALTHMKKGVMWFNGDVVFSPSILERTKAALEVDESFMVVMQRDTGDEEMKFSLDDEGMIHRISKHNSAGLGEAVGINYVSKKDVWNFRKALSAVPQQAYFEEAIEETVRKNEIQWLPIYGDGLYATEVDFQEDLKEANKHL